MSAARAPLALITGAGRGIGRATAEALAAEGYRLVLAEVRPALGRRTARALARGGADVLFVRTDVADARSVKRMAREVQRRCGPVDVLVNNAGVLDPGPLVRLRAEAIQRMLAVNLAGPLLVTRAVLPAMLRRRAGAIVNVASLLGKTGLADYVTYCASKFGVVGFTEALADELAGTGIQVWAVCPGQVDTPMATKTGVSARERRGLIRPEAVARAIAQLATGRRDEPGGAAIDVTR
ncbi:MAG TPA: SDR family oxidoreductase [Methylomirabilota bacterium]|nr:SDR family oxidoreductase [Methylomirabilota bacterium]